jgi:hypothetical protein
MLQVEGNSESEVACAKATVPNTSSFPDGFYDSMWQIGTIRQLTTSDHFILFLDWMRMSETASDGAARKCGADCFWCDEL